MKMIFKRTFLSGLVFFAAQQLCSMDDHGVEKQYTPENTAFSFDIDDVVSMKQKVWASYATLIPRALWHCPAVGYLAFPGYRKAMWKEVERLQSTTNGTTNIIHGVVQYLKNNGYGDLSAYEDEMVEKSINPYPLMRMINQIKNLKKMGYLCLGATNQDCKQHDVYSRKMGVALEGVFDGVLTTRVEHDMQIQREHDNQAQRDLDGLVHQYRHDQKNVYPIYVVAARAWKPQGAYFEAEKQLIKQLRPSVNTIIHTDDKEENVVGARGVGLKGLYFKLAGGTARKTAPDDIDATINAWRACLASEYSINLPDDLTE